MKINAQKLYMEIARHIPDWPVCPPAYYDECNNWYDFFDKKQTHLPPNLVKEWHPTKNGELTPTDVTIGSSKKVWWKCSRGHEWEATVNTRSRCNCPYCGGKRVNGENCLATVKPQIAKEWHLTKNGELTPNDVTSGSSKKVWWKCPKGHEWEQTIARRKKCPFCNGTRINGENCLAALNPILAKEWHPTKNGELTPNDVARHSGKKVWWLCSKGHEWQATINTRSRNGCPYCVGQMVDNENCLATVNQQIASEWHPTKNGKLTPTDVTKGSIKKVWWICKKGHTFEATINNRTSGKNCPYCAWKKVSRENCFAVVNPHLAKEWHPVKNGKLTAKDVAKSSHKKVWWKCRNGHAWEAVIASRTNGNGCPHCHRLRRV